jgi:hypothetical protein
MVGISRVNRWIGDSRFWRYLEQHPKTKGVVLGGIAGAMSGGTNAAVGNGPLWTAGTAAVVAVLIGPMEWLWQRKANAEAAEEFGK